MSALIGTKNPREYDQAVTLLKDLEALGQREGNAEAFAKRFRQLRDQHLRKLSRLDRFGKAGLQL